MTVRTLAFALMALGLALLLIGWQTLSPVGFVGPVLFVLSGVLLATRRRHGP